jgi:ribosomal protein S5
VVRATLNALEQLVDPKTMANRRGVSVEELGHVQP